MTRWAHHVQCFHIAVHQAFLLRHWHGHAHGELHNPGLSVYETCTPCMKLYNPTSVSRGRTSSSCTLPSSESTAPPLAQGMAADSPVARLMVLLGSPLGVANAGISRPASSSALVEKLCQQACVVWPDLCT